MTQRYPLRRRVFFFASLRLNFTSLDFLHLNFDGIVHAELEQGGVRGLVRLLAPRPSPVPTGEGIYFVGRFPGVALTDSLTPGYYLSPL